MNNYIKNKNRGFGIVETMLAITLLSFISLGLLSYLTTTVKLMVKSHQQTYGGEISHLIFTNLNNIPYFYVLDSDSSEDDYDLSGSFGPVTAQSAAYPYLDILDKLQTATQEAGFDSFRVYTEYMIRDLSDLDGDGETTDLRLYVDSNNDDRDDYDSNIRFFDQNNDGDYYDFYGSPEVSEEPDTHMKTVYVDFYKNNEVVFSASQLISLEKFTGEDSKSSGAELKIVISEPSESSYIYALETSQQQDAFSRTLSKSYPEDIKIFRADSYFDLNITGTSEPAADMDYRLNSATSLIKDIGVSDYVGAFNDDIATITTNLVEGENKIWAQATKSSHYSPWVERTVTYDVNPPRIQSESPTGTVNSRQPLIYAYITDEASASGGEASGICEDVLTLYMNGVSVDFDYSSSNGLISITDSNTGLPPVLSTGTTYTMCLEGGDNAYYKVMSTWTFICALSTTDNSWPTISQPSPSGSSASNPPTISCRVFDNQSGIVIDSIVMKLDGGQVVNATNIMEHFSPDTGDLTYVPADSLTSGTHTVEVTVSHWADSPANKKTRIKSWSFNVP